MSPAAENTLDACEGQPRRLRAARPRQWDVVLATSLGGVLGAEARYGVGVVLPHSAAHFASSTLLINATGSLLIGVLMVILLDLTSPHRLVRPLLGVGVLGGYTTYSTFAVDTEQLLLAHRPLVALLYVAATLAACGLAVLAGATLTRNIGEAVIAARLRRHREVRRTQ